MPGRRSHQPVLIAGGGMGGLTAAIALARQGVEVEVLERSAAFSEAGAGIQLGPNTMHVLAALGVAERLRDAVVFPRAIRLFDGPSGRELASLPLGVTAERRYGAPYALVHRADLQQALLQAARAAANITITNGFALTRYAAASDGVAAYSTAGEATHGALLVGADGLSSRVRAQLDPGARLAFSGRTAWRTLIDRDRAPEFAAERAVALWMAPGAHLVHYPVQGGRAVNVVAVIEDAWDKEGWNSEADPADLVPHFARWAEPARALLAAGPGWRKWALFSLRPLERWFAGRVVLLGDAAHPVLPFLAQGAAMAIEDAAVLARELASGGADVAGALGRYQQARAGRSARVQAASRRMGNVYHWRGPARWLRNAVLARRAPERHLARLDWLYRVNVTRS